MKTMMLLVGLMASTAAFAAPGARGSRDEYQGRDASGRVSQGRRGEGRGEERRENRREDRREDRREERREDRREVRRGEEHFGGRNFGHHGRCD